MARVPKPKQAAEKRPSGRMVVLAFAVAVGAAVALVVAALFLRNDDGGALTPSPTPAVDLSGIPQEGTFLGAGSATVTLIEYADLQCPFCRSYSEAVFPTVVDEYVRPGKVRTEFRGLAFLGADSEKALRYVLAAGLQNRLWDLQEALYRNHGAENSGWVSDELVRTLAEEIPDLDVDRLFEDAESDEVTALMEQSAEQAQAADVPGTPAFYVQIGEQEPYKIEVVLDPSSFRPALDDALAG